MRSSARLLPLIPLFAAAVAGCSAVSPRHNGGAPDEPASVVAVAPARVETLDVIHRASGTVRGRATAVLTSRTTGYVRAVEVRPGDVVKAGQVLALLEAHDVEASARRAKAGLEQSLASQGEAESGLVEARTNAQLAKTTRDRIAKLHDANAVSAQELDDAEARARAAAAQEEMAQARITAARHRIAQANAEMGEVSALLGYSRIVAPFAGRVIERHVDPGNLASPGTPLLVVEEEGLLRVEASVPESRAGVLALGDPVDVAVESAKAPLTGKVSEIVPAVDIASRAFLVKIDLGGDVQALRPGMFARASFPVGKRQGLVVPREAVTSMGALDRVFVVDEAGGAPRAHLRMVTLGETQQGRTEVLSGLVPGEKVVVAPPSTLKDGTRVGATEVKP